MTIRYMIGEDFTVFGRFSTGRTVTCALYNGDTGAVIALASNACAEIGSTGVYRFNSSNLSAPISARTTVVHQMTATETGLTDEGYIVIGDASAGYLAEIWQDRGLDSANPKTITEITAQTDYDEDAGAIHKDTVKVGPITTITRT